MRGPTRGSCAQRLSASLDSAQGDGRRPAPAGPGAQRLSASLDSALRRAANFTQCLLRFVLNAFRHHWIRHIFWIVLVIGLAMCSTPFGITGFGTCRRSTCRWPWTSAQRLSASLDSALAALERARENCARCSTPFGITGFGTASTPSFRWSNASAQRLSASLDSALDRPLRRLVIGECAQRLSASLDSAP